MAETICSGTVAGLLEQLVDDSELIARVRKNAEKRTFVDQMIAHRVKLDLSQDDVAKKLGCSQSKISKLENSDDEDLRLGDVANYAIATGMAVGLSLVDRRLDAVSKIKSHAFRIKELLQQIANMAQDDETMLKGAREFISLEVPINMLKMIVEVANLLPKPTESKDEEFQPGLIIEESAESDRMAEVV